MCQISPLSKQIELSYAMACRSSSISQACMPYLKLVLPIHNQVLSCFHTKIQNIESYNISSVFHLPQQVSLNIHSNYPYIQQ